MLPLKEMRRYLTIIIKNMICEAPKNSREFIEGYNHLKLPQKANITATVTM